MKVIELFTDSYERKARLYPAIVVLAPLLVFLVGVSPKLQMTTVAITTFASLGGLFLLSQVGRGRHKEGLLYRRWGGVPSVVVLRHSDRRVDQYTKRRYHGFLASNVPGTKILDTQEEAANAVDADEIYRAWSSYLRNNTRDKQRFPLVYTELVNYGYRRNLWALKPFAIFLIIVAIIAATCLLTVPRLSGLVPVIVLVMTLGVCCLLTLFWLFIVNTDWVKTVADSYAARLVESCDSLSSSDVKPAKKRVSKKGDTV